jgi:hypothetical protein
MCFLVAIVAAASAYATEVVGRVPRVLILYPYDERLPSTSIAGETARNRLIEATAGKIDLFSEFLDLSRFQGQDHKAGMASYLAVKYARVRPDVVIAFGSMPESPVPRRLVYICQRMCLAH